MSGTPEGTIGNDRGSIASGGLPTAVIDAVFHVGTMDKVNKRSVNLEGNGLSVSLHPNVWRYMDHGWISGDLWKLTRPESLFLDLRALTDAQRSEIVEWGIARGYVKRTPYEIWGMDKLWREFPGLVSHQAQVMDFLIILHARTAGHFDGVWWDNPVKVTSTRKGGSASKGTIFESHLPLWTIRKVGEDHAPDRHLFTPGGRPRKQAVSSFGTTQSTPDEEPYDGAAYGMTM